MSIIDDIPEWDDFDPAQMIRAIEVKKSEDFEVQAEQVVQDPVEVATDVQTPYTHTQMQFYLAQLGRSLRHHVWIPTYDQGKSYKNVELNELSIGELPPLPFSEDVLRIIRNIDVIWLQDDHPAHLFEVERTTSIYSGLLRMSDLVTLIPSLNIRMYICAGEDRKDKVVAEVHRPTFSRRKIPLATRCRFIAFEQLEAFMESEREYLHHFNVSILDELSESLAF